jgi:hypothetical protein
MPRTKLGDSVKAKEKKVLTLADIPNLPTSLTVQKASEVSGIGYQSIRALIKEGKVKAVKAGEAKYIIPTWNFIVDIGLFPEALLEKVYMQQLENRSA